MALRTSPADGNTLLMSNSHTVSMIPLTVRNPGFDPARDFTPVSLVATVVKSPEFAPKLAMLGITPAHRTREGLGALAHEVDQAHAAMIKAADYRMP